MTPIQTAARELFATFSGNNAADLASYDASPVRQAYWAGVVERNIQGNGGRK